MKTVIAGAVGECVHVAGVMNFLRLAEAAGWRTVFLGPAVSIGQFLKAAHREKADLVGVSYRLTPETGERLLGQFAEAQTTLEAICDLAGPGVADPLADPATLARAVACGILDAPQLRSNPYARGQVVTRIVDGSCVTVDSDGRPLPENERLARLRLEDWT